MPLFKTRQLGAVRSQNVLTKSLMIQANDLVTDTQERIKSMKVKGDSFGTRFEKKEPKSKSSEEKISDYECHLLAELEHLKITIMELKAKLQEKSRVLAEVQKKRKEENSRYHKIIEEMTDEHKLTKDELSRANLALNGMNDKLFKAEMDAKEKLDILKDKMEKEKAELLEEKDAEIAWRKEKVDTLKKQICDTLTGNSLVRQKQLDEMSKELDKVNQEADNLRLTLQIPKTSKVTKTDDISCLECRNKLMAMKLKDIEIEQLKTRLKFDDIDQ